jgi:hypothetical protein
LTGANLTRTETGRLLGHYLRGPNSLSSCVSEEAVRRFGKEGSEGNTGRNSTRFPFSTVSASALLLRLLTRDDIAAKEKVASPAAMLSAASRRLLTDRLTVGLAGGGQMLSDAVLGCGACLQRRLHPCPSTRPRIPSRQINGIATISPGPGQVSPLRKSSGEAGTGNGVLERR